MSDDLHSRVRAHLTSGFRAAWPELSVDLVGLALVALGIAWYHYVGSLTGYFLALITFGLAALIIGTIVYAAYQMRQS